ncbi:hypothetical protein V498_02428 [Pseudogymnoascus sp. VKM F-4517 (FW-2822)]|nr:hypothetical protein V498_02428 [Pseudogymnoascus sp. VKM F-4517 (FW-2822)]
MPPAPTPNIPPLPSCLVGQDDPLFGTASHYSADDPPEQRNLGNHGGKGKQLEEGTKRKAVAAAAAAEGPLDGQCIRRKELLKKKADYKSLF